MSLSSLPIELLYQVFKYLTNKSIAKLSCASHVCNIYALIDDEIDILYNHNYPLAEASGYGFLRAVEMLLKHGADVNQQDDYGETALHAACELDQTKTILTLIENGADVDIRDIDGCTTLYKATNLGRLESIKILLEHGANPDLQQNYGNTPLHYATKYGSIECVQLLLDHGANPNIQNINGETALQLAENLDKNYVQYFITT